MNRSAPAAGTASLREKWIAFAQAVYRIWISERPIQFAAAPACYAIFSFVPAICIAFILADFVVGKLLVAERIYRKGVVQ